MVNDYVLIDGEQYLIKEEDLGKFSLIDVVFPVYGSKTDLDENSIAYKIYENIFESEKIKLDNFKDHNKRYFN